MKARTCCYGFVMIGVKNAALIPLAELCDPAITKKYGVKPAAQVLDIVQTAATQKKVQIQFVWCLALKTMIVQS